MIANPHLISFYPNRLSLPHSLINISVIQINGPCREKQIKLDKCFLPRIPRSEVFSALFLYTFRHFYWERFPADAIE